jgi:quaternary ammonium compound-resistance protein SugE
MGPRKRVGPDRETIWGREVFGMKQYAWSILVVAGVFETGFSIGLKYSEGFTRLWPSIVTVIMIVLSLGLVGIATRSLPLGTAYAVWTGIGSVGTVALGIALFGESAALSRLACLGLIVSGVLGLKMLGK